MIAIYPSRSAYDISNSGRSINLSLTSNREPFTQHLTIYELSFVHTLQSAVLDSKCCAFCKRTPVTLIPLRSDFPTLKSTAVIPLSSLKAT
nr:hypothetical protein Iba_chr15cCG2790 [Ipomoea batatas]